MFLDDKLLYGDTTVILNSEARPEMMGNETLVITGSSRAGTSIAAYVYRRAGLNLGTNVNPTNHEDLEVLAAVKDGNLDELVEHRNAAYTQWGFKYPDAIDILCELDESLRNPLFVITYRNPLAIGRSKVNAGLHFAPGKFGLIAGIQDGLERLKLATQACRDILAPALLVNIDAARFAPETLTRELLEFVSADASEDLIQSIATEISVPGYKGVPSPESCK